MLVLNSRHLLVTNCLHETAYILVLKFAENTNKATSWSFSTGTPPDRDTSQQGHLLTGTPPDRDTSWQGHLLLTELEVTKVLMFSKLYYLTQGKWMSGSLKARLANCYHMYVSNFVSDIITTRSICNCLFNKQCLTSKNKWTLKLGCTQ